ncbi:MAG: TIGR04255 family protein [Pseudomonadales bacterium]
MDKYRKLNNQPLVFALAEFRFSPVLKIGEFIPELQEAFRKTYPLPETQQQQSVLADNRGTNVEIKSRWSFLAGDRRSAIIVDQDRMICFTQDYPRFEGFSQSCGTAIDHLKRIVDPNLLLRIGLRYGDCIRIGDDEKVKDYVDEYFDYPEVAKTLGEPEYQRDEVGISTSSGRMLIRSFYGVHPLVCMPDLQGLPGIPLPERAPSLRILLDFDHMWDPLGPPVTFDSAEILHLLADLHRTSRDAFWSMTTDEAKDKKWS